MATFQGFSLPLLTICLLSQLLFIHPVSAITYAQDVRAAIAALTATPGYALLAGQQEILITTLRQYPAEQPPATILAPNDTAILDAVDEIGQTKNTLQPIVQFHALQGFHTQEELSYVPLGSPLPTFNAAGVLTKSSPLPTYSAAGVLTYMPPLQFKSAKGPKVGSVTQLIYKGTYISVYGIDAVLIP